MEKAISETIRRRTIQTEYNVKHGIIPKTIKKDIRDVLEITSKEKVSSKDYGMNLSKKEKNELIQKLSAQMREAAKLLEFEHAALLRDKIAAIKNSMQ